MYELCCDNKLVGGPSQFNIKQWHESSTYCKFGHVALVEKLIDETYQREDESWKLMAFECVELFKKMWRLGIQSSLITLVAVISGCAELDSPDWTLEDDKALFLNVEVIQMLRTYKYSVSRQSSGMDKNFRDSKELCKSIIFDWAIAYNDIFQVASSSCKASKVQELLLLYVGPLSLDIRRGNG